MHDSKLHGLVFLCVISLLLSACFVMPIAATEFEEGWYSRPITDKYPGYTIDLTTDGNFSEYALASVVVMKIRPDQVSHFTMDTNTYEVEVDITEIGWYSWQVAVNYTQGDVQEYVVTNVSSPAFVLPNYYIFVCVGQMPSLLPGVYWRGVFVSAHQDLYFFDFGTTALPFAKVIDVIPVPPTKCTVMATFEEAGEAEVRLNILPMEEAGAGWTETAPTAIFDWCTENIPYIGIYVGAAISIFAQLLFVLFGSTEEMGLIPLLFTNFWILYIFFLMFSLMHAVSKTGRNLMTFFEVLVNDHKSLFTFLYDSVLKIFQAIMNVISTIAAVIKP